MLAQMRSRNNSRAFTQSLLNMSEEPNDGQDPVLPLDYQIIKPYTQTIVSQKNDNRNLYFMNKTSSSFKTHLTSHQPKQKHIKEKLFSDEFSEKRQISLSKVSVRFGRFHSSIKESPQTYNQTCFISKKLRQKQVSTKTQKKFNFTKIKVQKIRGSPSIEDRKDCRVYFSQQEQKARQLKSINLLKRKYTFFSKAIKSEL